MALFPPLPGQVIRYAYLWWSEARMGREDGNKDRPCGVVLTRVANRERRTRFFAGDYRIRVCAGRKVQVV
jgi:hypothetical protein